MKGTIKKYPTMVVASSFARGRKDRDSRWKNLRDRARRNNARKAAR